MRIYDAHVHLGAKNALKRIAPENQHLPVYENASDNPWERFRRTAERKKIEKALAFPFPFSELSARELNLYVLDSCRRNSDLLIPLVLGDDLQFLSSIAKEIAGVKEHFYLTRGSDATRFFPLYDFLEKQGKVLLIHPVWDERVSRLKFIRKNFPQLNIILAHAGRKQPFTGQEVLMVAQELVPARRRPVHLLFETSTVRDSEAIAKLVDYVGPDNVIFGTDTPFFKDNGEDVFDRELDSILEARMPDDWLQQVLSGNFRRLFLKDKWVRRATATDKADLDAIVNEITAEERKFLALDRKLRAIQQEFRNCRHVSLLEDSSGAVHGFLRQSDRPDHGCVVEELYVKLASRGRGYGRLLLAAVCGRFRSVELKTFAANGSMNRLVEQSGFSVESSSTQGKILNWRRTNGA
jgi:GNAT superfamily N-acetyltransferase